MTKFLVILLCWISFSSQDCPPRKEVICNWGSWSLYRSEKAHYGVHDIDPTLCTNIVYTFIGLNSKLEVDHLDVQADLTLGGFANLTELKTKNPCLQLTLAIGGWNEGSIKFSVAAYTEESRQKFADEILNFLTYYGFDGISIDWDYPNTRGGIEKDKINFPLLLRAIKETISPWGFSLSVAVGVQEELMHSSYDVKTIANIVNYIQLMAYDFTSSSSPTVGLSVSLTVVKEAVDNWLKQVVPEKLILGLQCYGRAFTLSDPDKHSPGDESVGPGFPGMYTKEDGFLAYYEVLDTLDIGMTTVVEDGTNYAYNDIDWITYENEKTIAMKVNYAMDKNLAGVMLWSIDLDDFNGLYGRKYPLLNSVNDAINNHEFYR